MQGPFRSISQSNRKRSFSELSVTFEVSSTRLHFRMISRRVFISTSQSNSFVVWHLSLSFGSSHSSTKSQVYFANLWNFRPKMTFQKILTYSSSKTIHFINDRLFLHQRTVHFSQKTVNLFHNGNIKKLR